MPTNFAIGFFLLLAPVSGLSAQTPNCQGPGHSRWAVKTSIPSGTDLSHSKAVSLKTLLAMKAAANVKKNDPVFETGRIPQKITPPGVKEGDLITTTGFLYLVMLAEDDCDYHIQISTVSRTLSNPAQASDDCLIVELPRSDFVSDPELKAQIEKIRADMLKRILRGKEASNNGSVMKSSFQIRVTGQLFFDSFHQGSGPLRGRKGMKSHTMWELHPVTNWEFVTKAGTPAPPPGS